MKPIQLHPLQIEALPQATKLLFVIDLKEQTLKVGDAVTCIKPLWSGTIGSGKYTTDHIGKIGVISHISKCLNHVQVTYEDGTYSPFAHSQLLIAPLQKGDEFLAFDIEKSLFKLTNPKEETLNHFTYYSGGKYYIKNSEGFKGVCIDAEVKRVQELTKHEWKQLGVPEVAWLEVVERINWCEQYREGTYEANPYCFIATVEMKG